MTRLKVSIVLFDKEYARNNPVVANDDELVSSHYVYITGVDDQYCYIEKKDKPMPEDNEITLLEDKHYLRNRTRIPLDEIIEVFGVGNCLADIIRGYGQASTEERRLALDLVRHNLVSVDQF